MSFCLKEVVWSRGTVVPDTVPRMLAGGVVKEGETEKEACSCHPYPPCPQRLSFSTALNNGFCLRFVSGDDSVAETFEEL